MDGGGMRLQIRMSDGDGSELKDLYRWLRDDEDGPDEVRLDNDPTPGGMGGLEFVDVIVTQAVAVGNLALAYASWRGARCRSAARFTFTRPSDGVTITVDNASQETVRRLAEVLSEPDAAGVSGREPGGADGTR